MESQCATFTVGRSCTVMGENSWGHLKRKFPVGGGGGGIMRGENPVYHFH